MMREHATAFYCKNINYLRSRLICLRLISPSHSIICFRLIMSALCLANSPWIR